MERLMVKLTAQTCDIETLHRNAYRNSSNKHGRTLRDVRQRPFHSVCLGPHCGRVVALPLPWLLFGLVNGKPVEVNSKGMVCSIVLLFAMLIFVILSIACFRWKMNKGLGFTMFILYFVFVAVSLSLEYGYLHCPSE
ncbi:hypothetical protein EVAR_61308_1 [Eumeta japonica]|uniref:Sodium/potassium/calcium exchanger Nckx30C n=1 Tax=Eumeta variegata TaxID=151549 RepID=A0A4C1XJG7_EUMVA|nr:hypothetical protein EVAR_61308_1 [Eumeta japonica]